SRRRPSGAGPFECSQCGSRFASQRNLTRHESSHSERPRLECEVCERAYTRLDALVRHSVEAHEQRRQFPCPKCRWQFTQRRILEYHVRRHEREQTSRAGRPPRPHRCAACRRGFADPAELEAHVCRAAAHGQMYICDICGKRIKTKVWLSRHRLLHDATRPAKCDTCGQGFIDDKALQKHARTHTD
ncbi:zinc finger protein 672-like, partial [Pollicipes pollicipes]|uniref:zinc finger protein 672-like n=1 Tax=Pollicipes pollicipes TaxID=41117 RepID=UPI0018855BF2